MFMKEMWAEAAASEYFLSLHDILDAANNAMVDTGGDGVAEPLCPIGAGGYRSLESNLKWCRIPG